MDLLELGRSSEPETCLSYGLEFSHCYTFAPAISAMRDRLLCCRCCQFSLLVLFVCVCCVFEVALGYSTERLEKHMADDPRTITLDLRQRRQTGSTGDLDRVFPDPDVVSYWSITKLTDWLIEIDWCSVRVGLRLMLRVSHLKFDDVYEFSYYLAKDMSWCGSESNCNILAISLTTKYPKWALNRKRVL